MILPMGDYAPDRMALGGGDAAALNVVPSGTGSGYRPLRDMCAWSPALPDPVRGAFATFDAGGHVQVFAATADRLHLVSATAVAEKGSGYATGERDGWEFVRWNTAAGVDQVIATNYADPVQAIATERAAGARFAPLIAAPAAGAPRARHLAVVHSYLVLGNTDAAENEVRWSALGDASDFEIDGGSDADAQLLKGNGGWIQRLVGGEYGSIFQERAIWRMDYVGAPEVFAFRLLEEGRGTPFAGSPVRVGRTVYYIGDDGFYAWDGTRSHAIGAGKVDRTFVAEVDFTCREQVSGAFDPVAGQVMWNLCVRGHADKRPNRQYVYDIASGRFAIADMEPATLFGGVGAGFTLEGLETVAGSLEALPESLDSRVWMGGAAVLMGADAAHRLVTFEGPPRAATVDTAELQPIAGRRSMVTSAFPLVDGAGRPGSASGVSCAVGVRERLGDRVRFKAPVAVRATGEAPQRASGRYVRCRVAIPAGIEWRQVAGVELPDDAIHDEGAR